MRSPWAELLVVVALGCAGTPSTRVDDPEVAGAAALPGTAERFQVLHRVRARFGDADLGTLYARLWITVVARRAHEADLAIVAQLLADDRSVAATDELRATVRDDGTMAGPSRSRCVDGAFDELVSTRLVDAILGQRPSRETLRASLRTELDEGHADATYASVEGRLVAEAPMTLRAAALLGDTYRGEVTLRVEQRLGEDDVLTGRTRATLRGEVERTHGPPGVLEVVSETDVRRYDGGESPLSDCRAGFDGATVVAALGARRRAIQACYEAELADDPTLTGRVILGFRIGPDGEVDAVEARGVEGPPWPEITECMTLVVDAIRLDEGPPEATAFEVPFVLTPR